jgi:hypothetical protein
LCQLDLFGPIRAQVQIKQKTIKHTPIDKLTDAFISRFSGAHGLVEINTRLRADPGLQCAFGRTAYAEQLVVQETLSACTPEHVIQLHQALDEIYRSHSQGFQHDYQARFPTVGCGPDRHALWTQSRFCHERVLSFPLSPPRAATGSRAGYSL